MSLSPLKNIPSITLYFASIICFIVANVCKENNVLLYYILLGLGLVLFLFGIVKKMKK